MLVKFVVAALMAAVSQSTFSASFDCSGAAKDAEKNGAMISPPVAYEVNGEGRLYFYSAPDDACKKQNVFVVPKDSLIAYTEYKGWYSVMYMTKHNDPVDGWVHAERLKSTGTVGPSDR